MRWLTLNPNLVEGREFFNPQNVALDQSVTPPILYVSDTGNNRVLAWKNAASFTNGKPADLVVGQRDFFSTLASGPATRVFFGSERAHRFGGICRRRSIRRRQRQQPRLALPKAGFHAARPVISRYGYRPDQSEPARRKFPCRTGQ